MGKSLEMSLRKMVGCLMLSGMYFELAPMERLALSKLLLRRYFA